MIDAIIRGLRFDRADPARQTAPRTVCDPAAARAVVAFPVSFARGVRPRAKVTVSPRGHQQLSDSSLGGVNPPGIGSGQTGPLWRHTGPDSARH